MRMPSSCVSLKFATTHKIGEAPVRSTACPALTYWPGRATRSLTRPSTGARTTVLSTSSAPTSRPPRRRVDVRQQLRALALQDRDPLLRGRDIGLHLRDARQVRPARTTPVDRAAKRRSADRRPAGARATRRAGTSRRLPMPRARRPRACRIAERCSPVAHRDCRPPPCAPTRPPAPVPGVPGSRGRRCGTAHRRP